MQVVYKKYDTNFENSLISNNGNNNINNVSMITDYSYVPKHCDEKIPNAIFAIYFIVWLVFLCNGKFCASLKNASSTLKQNVHVLLAIFSLSILLAPFVAVFLFGLVLYRSVANVYLRIKFGRMYKGLMRGTDVMWAIEEDTSRSVINILAVVECDESKTDRKENNGNNNLCLYRKVRQVFKENFFDSPETKKYPKVFYTRHKAFGLNYWMDHDDLNVDDFVRTFNAAGNDAKEMEMSDLQTFISKQSNSPLPINNTALIEILVSERPVFWRKTVQNESNVSKQFPIIVRVHHSLGDGVALLKLLLGLIIDEDCDDSESSQCNNDHSLKFNNKTAAAFYDNNRNHHQHNHSTFINIKFDKFFLKFTWLRTMLECYSRIMNTFKVGIRHISVLLLAPATLIQQLLMRPADRNLLHGPELSGEKILVWSVDDDSRHFESIKRIKEKFTDTKFSDVLVTAISASLAEHFIRNAKEIPETIAAVIPFTAGITKFAGMDPAKYSKHPIVLQNNFSVAILDLPIDVLPESTGNKDNDYFLCSDECIIDRLEMVKEHMNLLRNSVDYHVNYMFLSVSAILTEPMIKPVVNSAHNTLVISSVPGPREISVLGGNALADLVFWVPHKGITGLGISVLTYANRLQFGLTVDKALVPCASDAQMIVDNFQRYLKIMDSMPVRK